MSCVVLVECRHIRSRSLPSGTVGCSMGYTSNPIWRIAEANTAFTSLATEAGKYPTLAALYSDDAEPLLTQAYKVAHAYQQRTGLVASHAEVAEYLESIHSDRVRRLHQPSEPRATASQTGTAHGQRTLSTDSASERRSPTRSLEELTPDERRRELISVAKKARQAG